MTALILTPRDLLARLVAFPTVSQDSNLELVDFIARYLRSHGIDPVIVPSPDGTKAALYAQVGPDAPGGVVLSGHTDVVPVDGQDWTSDPFVMTERDGRLYGRGTCDMKGFDALAIAALVRARNAGIRRPLQLALSYDEEVGCFGAPVMIAHMARSQIARAEVVIVGEPTSMKVVTGHKGGYGYHIKVRGHPVHSSLLPEGVSAIMEAARIIAWANETNATIQSGSPTTLAAPFHPPFTTLHVGTIHGGTAMNITASDCTFDFEIRTVPGETNLNWEPGLMAKVDAVQAAMQRIHPATRVTVTLTSDVPALVPEKNGAAERLVRQLTGDNGSHVVSFGTEAGQFQQAGYSTVVCGPGDIAIAHQADEFITVEQMQTGEAFMGRLIDWLGT